jgi:hypothetical protein
MNAQDFAMRGFKVIVINNAPEFVTANRCGASI